MYRDARRAQGLAENTISVELALVSHPYEIVCKEWGMEGVASCSTTSANRRGGADSIDACAQANTTESPKRFVIWQPCAGQAFDLVIIAAGDVGRTVLGMAGFGHSAVVTAANAHDRHLCQPCCTGMRKRSSAQVPQWMSAPATLAAWAAAPRIEATSSANDKMGRQISHPEMTTHK